MFKRLGVVCVMVAIDLGFTNMAISMLPLALQQCIAATTPAATVTIESVYERRLQHPFIYTVIACLCAGAVLAELGSEVAADVTLGLIAATDRGYFRYRPRGSGYA